jgi:integrase
LDETDGGGRQLGAIQASAKRANVEPADGASSPPLRPARRGGQAQPLGRHRDGTMILVAWRHGFRVSEPVDPRWDQIDFATATLHVRRVKRGTPSTHPILGDELRALRRLQREQVLIGVGFRRRSAS